MPTTPPVVDFIENPATTMSDRVIETNHSPRDKVLARAKKLSGFSNFAGSLKFWNFDLALGHKMRRNEPNWNESEQGYIPANSRWIELVPAPEVSCLHRMIWLESYFSEIIAYSAIGWFKVRCAVLVRWRQKSHIPSIRTGGKGCSFSL